MSLNPAETAATSRELHALRGSLPLADAPINSSLGYQAGGLAEVLDIEASPRYGAPAITSWPWQSAKASKCRRLAA